MPTLRTQLLILLVLLLPSFVPLSGNAQIEQKDLKNVVLPLEGFLVQRIPLRNRNKMPQTFLVKVQDSERAYVLRPFASEFLTSLETLKLNVFIISLEPESVTRSILEAFPEGRAKALAQNWIRDRSAAPNGKLSLRALNLSENEESTILTHGSQGVVESDLDRTVSTGALLYFFPTYQMAVQEKIDQGEHAAYFAKDEQQWQIDNNRLVFSLYLLLLRKVVQLEFKSVNAALEAFRVKPETVQKTMKDLIAQDLKGSVASWDYDKEKGLSCHQVEVLTGKKLKVLPLDECVEKLTTYPQFDLDPSSKTVKGCSLFLDPDRKIEIPKNGVDLGVCLKEENAQLLFAWSDHDREQCHSYLQIKGDFYRVRSEKQVSCKDDYSLKSVVQKKYLIYKEFPGMRGLTLEELEKRLQRPPPTLAEFDRTYKDPQAHPKWVSVENCMVGYRQHSLTKRDASGNLLKECQADILYSWGPLDKLNVLKSQIGNQDTWQPIRGLYTTPGAVATFNYGPIPLRIKIKSDVQYVATDSHYLCRGDLSEKNRVFFRLDSFNDWLICDPNVIHSWSHSTPEHYDEVVRDYRVQIQKDRKITPVYYFEGQSYRGTIFVNFKLNGRYGYDQPLLETYMKEFVKRVQENKEEIFFNPTLPPQEKTRSSHFKTKRPLYFHGDLE